MTENNTGDRRFWMAIAEYTDGSVVALLNKDSGSCKFSDEKEASEIAEKEASYGAETVYVVEATSRYTLPLPKVTKQNLHIPPVSSKREPISADDVLSVTVGKNF
jgi:hypothetical protein